MIALVRPLLVALAAAALLAQPPRAEAAPPATSGAPAAKAPAKREWSAAAVDGAKVAVPAADQVSVIACVRPNQAQSRTTLEQIRATLSTPGAPRAQVIVVVSGEQAGDAPKQLAELARGWPIVLDPDFAATGTFNVHVWPTTIVVRPDGVEAGHLGGVNGSFAADLQDYLAYASGAIDEAALKSRLAEHQFVVDGPSQRADRHATVAARLLESGHVDQAAATVEEGLKLRADDAKLQVLRCRVLLARKQSIEALAALDKIPANAAPAWQMAELRGRALVDLERWDEASGSLREALKLNPRPAEAHYLLGKVYEHAGEWEQASKSYRAAYEARLAVPAAGS